MTWIVALSAKHDGERGTDIVFFIHCEEVVVQGRSVIWLLQALDHISIHVHTRISMQVGKNRRINYKNVHFAT